MHAQVHPEIDLELDARLEARAREGSCVIESRLAAWLATNGPASSRSGCGSTATTSVRAARVAERDGIARRRRLCADNAARASRSSTPGTSQAYGIDLDDRTPYDLILDSSDTSAATLSDRVIALAHATFG